jgi:hypothetical protein
VPWKITTSGGGTYQGIAAYIVILFTRFGVFIAIYILIGVFHNTAPPHIPSTPSSLTSLHSWVQYFISIFFWPLSLWHPVLTLGKWTLPEALRLHDWTSGSHHGDAGEVFGGAASPCPIRCSRKTRGA